MINNTVIRSEIVMTHNDFITIIYPFSVYPVSFVCPVLSPN